MAELEYGGAVKAIEMEDGPVAAFLKQDYFSIFMLIEFA